MKRLVIGLILVTLLSVPMVAMAVEQIIPVQAQIPGQFSCTITDEFARTAGWWPTWILPPATTTTTKWGNIRGSSNYDWQVSADMGSVGWLVNSADPSIHLGDGLKIVMETWPESNVYVDGWSHNADLTVYNTFDNDYSLKQTTASEQPGAYAGTITFTCVNLYSGTCGDNVCSSGETSTTCPADCTAAGTCGDNVCSSGETSTTCPADCTAAGTCADSVCSSGETSTTCPADCTATATCGDGTLLSGIEACDDGNTVAGDGCSATCSIETGYICTSNNYAGQAGCSPLIWCNDGMGALDPGEECDPEITPAGCSATCTRT